MGKSFKKVLINDERDDFLLEVRNLSKRYGEKQAIDSISFSIEGKQAVGFLGINGAGKTTTMNILTGYLSASDGDVIIDGVDVLTDPLKAKTKIGYLPEQPPVYPDMTVKEYLHFIYDLKKVKKNRNISQKKEEYLQQIMDLVKISDVKERMIRNLSKGYRQRVGLAQALVGDPQILILDEPTVGLDPAQIIEIRELIRQLAKTRTVILSSHILSEVQAVCDRIIILHQGRIVADGSAQELAEHLSGSRQIEMEIEGNQKTIQELLRKIPSVVKVESGEKNNYTVFLADDCHDSTSIRRSIFKTLSQADCIILSMSKRSMNLEEIFLRLTAGDQAQEIEDQIGDQTSAPTETNLTENKTDPVTPKEGETQEEEADHDSNL
ncbi:MAG: ABC transporter ATP-binding protein [Negativibacillus massiliensis]|nr:ABC transporter ATP-binding protein [Negativibacillus massiliensis]MDY4048336.1 ABC transporter ATP-binding protein [Negativibacillus massiliensis]